jgi:hypothetical protein
MSALLRTQSLTRIALRRSAIAAPALFVRPIRPLPLHARWISTNPADPTSKFVSKAQAKGGYATPYDVPLSEQAREIATDLKIAAKTAAGEVKEKVGELAQKAKQVGAQAQSKLSEAAKESEATAETAAKSAVKTVKAKAQAAKASIVSAEKSVESGAHRLAGEVKHAGQVAASKVKQGVRAAEDAVKEATSTGQATTLHPASSAFTKEDFNSPLATVRHAAASAELSTTAGRGGRGGTLSHAPIVGAESEEELALSSGRTMGLDQDSVKKSLLDGPQRMPEGVGKRAVGEDGRPMETGAERS